MVALDTQEMITKPEDMAREVVSMVTPIASHLHKRYGWVDKDDLGSYAYLGLVKAAKAYQASRGIPFEKFAFRKGMYGAIDEMRKDGILRRRQAAPRPTVGSLIDDIADPSGENGLDGVEQRDMCKTLLGGLSQKDRQVLMMYYAQHMTFKEIGEVFDVSESAICLRHKAIIGRMRKMSTPAEAKRPLSEE
jgi:RNA polymerase sigma factor (sigma-70 family)